MEFTGLNSIVKMDSPKRFLGLFIQICFSIVLASQCLGRDIASMGVHSNLISSMEEPDSTTNRVQLNHELGLALGTTSGYGIGYRVWAGKLGGQIVGAPFKTTDVEQYNVGLTLLYSLVKTDIYRFFLYQSNQYRSSKTYYAATSYYDGTTQINYIYAQPTLKSRYWAHGIGMGFEIYRPVEKANPFGITFMTGLGSYKNFTQANLTAEISVMYKFRK
jgi:hypothetical protein